MISAASGVDRPRADGTRRASSRSLPWMGIFCFVVALGLLGRLLSYDLQHDEQIHVTAGVMLGGHALYRDLGYNHLPNLPWLLHAVYAVTGTTHYLLVGRIVIFLAWLATFAALALIALRHARSPAAAALGVLLLAGSTLWLGPAGMIVSNNLLPIPFALFGLHLFLTGLDTSSPRPWYLAAAGLSLAIAIGFKANYLFLAPPFVIALLLLPADISFGRRLVAGLLPFAVGGVVGGLPTLVYLAADADGLLAHTLRYFTEAHAAYWHTLDTPKVMTLAGKVQLAEQLWLAGTTLLALCLIGYLALVIAFSRDGRRRLWSWPILLVAALAGLGALVSFVPTPAFPQYFTPPIVFLIVLAILLYGRLEDDERHVAAPLLIAAGLLAILAGGSRLLVGLPALGNPDQWAGFQIHRLGTGIAGYAPTEGARGKAATLSPILALEGGLDVYPEFAAGPFVYRVAEAIPLRDRQHYRTTSEAGLTAFLDADPPATIITGLERDLDQGFEAYAASHGYREVALKHADAGEGRVRAYVRSGSPITTPRR